MDIQVETCGNRRLVHIKGKVTFEYCSALQHRLDSFSEEGVREVLIDFRMVPFMDSSGIGEILRLFKRMRDTGGEVILKNPNLKLRSLFTMYRFDQFMKIQEPSDSDANE